MGLSLDGVIRDVAGSVSALARLVTVCTVAISALWGQSFTTCSGNSSDICLSPTTTYVGIGSTNPEAPLTFDESFYTAPLGKNYGQFELLLGPGASAGTAYGLGLESYNMGFASKGGYKFYQQAGTTPLMVVGGYFNSLLSGNVGIGTATPQYLLDVEGTSGQINSAGGYCIGGNCISSWQGLGSTNITWTGAQTFNGSATFPSGIWSSGGVGIGTTSPSALLTLQGTAPPSTPLLSASYTTSGSPLYALYATTQADSSTNTNQVVVGIGTSNPQLFQGIIAGQGLDIENPTGRSAVRLGSGYEGLGQEWEWQSTVIGNAYGAMNLSNLTNGTNPFTVLSSGNVGIGILEPVHTLQVAGTIGAEEIVVSSTGADYVFEPGYPLKPLAEVDRYIQQHQHLPGIPAAKEIQEKGVSLGAMQAKLLAKVEELTLHMIQQDKDNRELREQVTRQEKQNRELRERIAHLETGAAAR
jgi:hypothetical protein